MADITVEMIKSLRGKTSAGMMDCKKALQEAGGDLEEAETILRKMGIADADKKSARTAKEGVIAARISEDGAAGVLLEVNCETDFVAKNENFTAFVDSLLDHSIQSEAVDSVDEVVKQKFTGDDSHTVEEVVKAKVGELGENLIFQRYTRYDLGGTGKLASYIHLQGKVGVLIEVHCGKTATAGDDTFAEVVKDLTLHIAAAQPVCVSRDEVPADLVEKEREIYRDQVKNKPDNIIEKIVEGKLSKFYSNVALLEQGFVKDPDQSIADLLSAKSKDLDDELTVVRFVRYAIGETAS